MTGGEGRLSAGAQLAARAPLLAPDPEVPHWREADGTRLSYSSLRCELDPADWDELREAHLAAIRRIAAAAVAAAERRDGGETARLPTAAARLCGEIRGLWPACALETRET